MPYHSEVFVVNLIACIEIPHFCREILVAFDGIIDNVKGDFIVAVYGGWFLWMAKLL